MSDFPFPLASFIHKSAVDNKSLYFTAHEIVRKNLETKRTKFLKLLRLIRMVLGLSKATLLSAK